MNHREKFDAASYVVAGEIRNRTKTQNYKNKQRNSNRYIQTLPIGMCG